MTQLCDTMTVVVLKYGLKVSRAFPNKAPKDGASECTFQFVAMTVTCQAMSGERPVFECEDVIGAQQCVNLC